MSSQNIDVHLIDGTETHQSYGVVARRGNIFLGIRLCGMTDGKKFGLPSTTYLHGRLRSARSDSLSAQLGGAEQGKIVQLPLHQLSVDSAWPNLSFEKVDAKRASLGVGLFIQGSLITNTAAVLTRIQKGDLFRKLIDYAIDQAGPENRIVSAEEASLWLADQAKPMLTKLAAKIALSKTTAATLHEFGTKFQQQVEVVGPHAQQFQAMYQTNAQAETILAVEGYASDMP
jgi:hypothetical protein